MMGGPLIVWIEFVVCMTLIGVAGSRLIRYGDVIASEAGLSRRCVFNLVTLAFVDVLYRQDSVYAIASRVHVSSASLGIMMLMTSALNLTLSTQCSMPNLGQISSGIGTEAYPRH